MEHPSICSNIPSVGLAGVRGFTLIELMITLVVAAALLGLAVPSFRTFLNSNRLTTASNDLHADIVFARSEALKRQGGATPGQVGQMIVCVSSNGSDCSAAPTTWDAGWIVFWDQDRSGTYSAGANDVLLKSHAALPPELSVATAPADTVLLAYTPLGTLNSVSVVTVAITNTNISKSRKVTITTTGQAAVATCDTPCT